jgi:hypothetical protein
MTVLVQGSELNNDLDTFFLLLLTVCFVGSRDLSVDNGQCGTRYRLLPVRLTTHEAGKPLLLCRRDIFWLRVCFLPLRLGVRGRTVTFVDIVEVVKLQNCAVFQTEHLTEPTVGDGIEDRNLGRAAGRGGILCKGVTGREDYIKPDAALRSITVVFEFQPVSVGVLLGVDVVGCGRCEGGEPETGSLEIH